MFKLIGLSVSVVYWNHFVSVPKWSHLAASTVFKIIITQNKLQTTTINLTWKGTIRSEYNLRANMTFGKHAWIPLLSQIKNCLLDCNIIIIHPSQPFLTTNHKLTKKLLLVIHVSNLQVSIEIQFVLREVRFVKGMLRLTMRRKFLLGKNWLNVIWKIVLENKLHFKNTGNNFYRTALSIK